jgi:prolyl-tRNA synthetase
MAAIVDLDRAGLDVAFARMRAAYERIFARCGLEALPAEAFSGAMGGNESIEFVVRTPAGEDEVVHCIACGYVANLEVARSRLPPVVDSPGVLEEFATPGIVTIEALAAPPYSVTSSRQLKTLVYITDGKPTVAVVRGDHMLNEAKLQAATGAAQLRPAQVDEVFALIGAHPGSLGTVGFSASNVWVDSALAGRTRCDATLDSFAALEVGHIFKLGTRYSEPMGATVLADRTVERSCELQSAAN